MARAPSAAAPARSRLHLGDVGGLRALLSLGHPPPDPLPLFEAAESFAGDGAVMDEDVLTIVAPDESVPFLRVKPLHRSLRHAASFPVLVQREAACLEGERWCHFLEPGCRPGSPERLLVLPRDGAHIPYGRPAPERLLFAHAHGRVA